MSSPGLLLFAIALAATGGAAAGCARNAEEKQLDAMRAEIDKTREERDNADAPITPSPPPTSSGPALVVPEAYTAAPIVRPPPPIVQLGEDGTDTGDSAEADPQDTSPRPSIRVFGSVRSGRNGTTIVDEQVENTTTDDRSAPPPTSSLAPEAKRAYDAAMTLFNAKRYDQALDALAAFLVKWPDHPYADNAMYWRGECYFAKGDYARAADQFEGVVKRFPAGDKVPDALLKLGMSQDKLGHGAKAKESYDRLVHQFPDSDAAHHVPSVRASSPPSPGPVP
jgi:tol-pal system protein YbgF